MKNWDELTEAEKFKEIFRNTVKRPGAEKLLAWLEDIGFFTAPASTKYHGNYAGGLVEHSNNVYRRLVKMVADEDKRLQRTSPEYSAETLAVAALLHDVCKADAYRLGEDGKYTYTNSFPAGHGEKSIIIIMGFMYLTEEEVNMLIDKAKEKSVRLGVLLELLYATGMRVSELVCLPFSVITEELEFLRIIGKGNKERCVPLNPLARQAIKAYLLERELHLKRPSKWLFPSKAHEGHLTRDGVFKA